MIIISTLYIVFGFLGLVYFGCSLILQQELNQPKQQCKYCRSAHEKEQHDELLEKYK
jgi:hypothetical protein